MEDKTYYYVEDFYGGMIIAEENIKTILIIQDMSYVVKVLWKK